MKDLNTNGMNKPNNTKEEDLRPLPEGWVWTNVGQVTLPVEKVSPKQKPNIPFVYIDISSIDNSIQKIVEPKEYLGLEAPSRARQLVRVNDVVFSTVRTYLRNVALVPEIYNGQIASTGFTVLRASNSVKSKFLFYFTLTDEFLSPLNELQRGTSYPAVRDGDVRVQPFPLPPLTEQERIVARLEELLSELEAGVAALERVRAGAKRYKASVLKAACEGKLFGDKGIVNGELPEGWVWKNIRECGTVITGTTPSKKDPENYGNHLPFVKPPELKDCSIFTAEDNLSEKGAMSARVLPPASVLVSCIGNLGKTGINRVPVAFNQQINAIILAEEIMPEFGFYYFQSSEFKEVMERISSATTIAIVNKSKFESLPFPLPPLEEQRRIVAAVERWLESARAVEYAVEAALKRARRLRRAVLRSAFEGRLV